MMRRNLLILRRDQPGKAEPTGQSLPTHCPRKENASQMSVNTHEPTPVHNDRPATWSLVMEDMAEREVTR